MLEALPQNCATVVGNFWVELVVLDQCPKRIRRIPAIPFVYIVAEVFDDRVERGNMLTKLPDRRTIAEETVEEGYDILFGLGSLLAKAR